MNSPNVLFSENQAAKQPSGEMAFDELTTSKCLGTKGHAPNWLDTHCIAGLLLFYIASQTGNHTQCYDDDGKGEKIKSKISYPGLWGVKKTVSLGISPWPRTKGLMHFALQNLSIYINLWNT